MDTPVDPDMLAETRDAGLRGTKDEVRRDPLEPGTRLGRYEIQRRLGRGGMGEVWLAHDTDLDREVAIKLLRPDRRRDAGGARMLREAQAMARLRHPNVVTVHDVGTFGRQVFVAMEYVRGQTLEGWLTQTRTHEEILGVFDQAARGLSAAHDAGLVHRDFKPENVMVDGDGRAQVMDFGLAREGDLDGDSGAHSEPQLSRERRALDSVTGRHSLVSQRLTVTGAMVGTPAYMAPEQHLGQGADPCSDQFAFAVSLYEALYGERPYRGETLVELAAEVTGGQPRAAPAGASVSPRVRSVLLRAIARDPAERYPSMAALRAALVSATAPRKAGWVLAGAAAVVAVGVYVVASDADPAADPCADAAEAVTPTWDAESRAATHDAFVRSGVGFADDTLERLERRLTAYVDDLQSQAVEACRDTRVRGVQSEAALDHRMACLRDRDQALDAVVRRAQSADADFIERALETASGLPAVSDCAQASTVAATEPDFLSQRRSELLDLRVQLDSGHADSASEALDELVAELEQSPPGAALVDALLLRSQARTVEQGRDQGIADAERAIWIATEQSLEQRQVIAGVQLADLTISYMPKLATRWLAHAGALLRRHPERFEKLRAEHGSLQCRRLLYLSDYPAAERCATDLLETLPPGDSPLEFVRLAARGNLASTLRRQGRLLDALAEVQAIVEDSVQLYGPQHPKVVATRIELAELYTDLGRHAEAAVEEKAAIAVLEAGWERSPQRLDEALTAFAVQRMRRGDFEDALPFLERAVERADQKDPLSSAASEARSMLGVAYWFLERYPEAEAMLRLAREIAESSLGAEHPRTAMYLDNLATALERQGKVEEALELHAKALPILEKAFGPGSPTVAVSLRDQARALASAERYEAAARLLERSVRIFVTANADVVESSEARFDLARVLWNEERERPRAIALAEAARRGYVTVARDEEVAEIDAWMGEVVPGARVGDGGAALPAPDPPAPSDGPPSEP